MESYKIIREVGSGTFGDVWQAIRKESNELVAIKKMKKKCLSDEYMNLREVKSLRKMNHPSIVKLIDFFRESDFLYFVFEYMEFDLYKLMKDRKKPFSEAEVRNLCFQVFQGLAHIHQRGYFHRDLKPENLLVTKDVVKIADFGLAREINSLPPFTEYVSTRWYRAPEVLLQSPRYGPPVDMWAMGAIMAELFTLCPLFPGSSEADEIYKICCVIGNPTKSTWSEGLELATAMRYQFPQVAGVSDLSVLIPGVSKDAITLITSLCSWDPCKRPSASEALQHPFFQSCFYVPPSVRFKSTAIASTPPSGSWAEARSGRRYGGSFSNPKTANNFSAAKSHTYPNAGVQRKLVMSNQDVTKDDKNLKIYSKEQPKYRPPVMNSSHVAKTHGLISDAAENLGNMSLGSNTYQNQAFSYKSNNNNYYRRPFAKQEAMPMKAGGWKTQSDRYLAPSQELDPRRAAAYLRKVAG